MGIFSQNKPKRLLFLFGSLAFLFFSIFSPAKALILSQVFFGEFNIEKTVFDAGETIKGNFTIWNSEDAVVPDISYRFGLIAKDGQGDFTVVWDDQLGERNLTLLSGQTIAKNFSYQLPKRLSPGEYEFRVQLYNSKGIPMAWQDIAIKIDKTEGGVLDLQKASFVKDGETPGTIFYYNYGEAPKISFEIANKSYFTVKGSPKIAIYKDNINGAPAKEIRKDQISLSAGESATQEIDIDPMSGSDAYIVRLAIYDQNNERISNIVDFIWSVATSEGDVEILEIKTDKPSYDPGDEAKITVDLGSQSEEAKRGNVLVRITDGGEVVGEAEREVDLETGKIEMQIPISKKISNPKIETIVTDKKDGTLDQYSAEINTEEEKKPEEKPFDWSVVGGIVFAVLTIIIAVILLIVKKKKAAVKTMIFAFVLGGLFFGGTGLIQAKKGEKDGKWEEISSSGVAISISEPNAGNNYSLGNYARFYGNILTIIRSFENTQFEFFISEETDQDPVLKEEIIDGDKVKSIDVAATLAQNHGFKIESLGTDVGTLKTIFGFQRLEFDQSPLIPMDDAYLGKAKLYIQFKGYEKGITHFINGSWEYEIAALEVTVQKNEEGGLYIDLEAKDGNDNDLTEGSVVQPADEMNYSIDFENYAPCATIKNPIDAMLVLDRSGSMAWVDPSGTPRMDAAKKAAKAFVEIIKKEGIISQIGIASYESKSTLDAQLTSNLDSLGAVIDSLNANGGTCMSCGTVTADKELKDRGRANTSKYIILMTDGQTNNCIYSCPSGNYYQDCYSSAADEALARAKQSVAKIYTIGFGKDAAGIPPSPTTTNTLCKNPAVIGNPSACCGLLNAIAENKSGTYSYAPGEEELIRIYEAIAGAIVGQSIDTKMIITIPDGTSLVSGSLDSRCVFDGANTITCDKLGDDGLLNCGGKNTNTDPVKFKLKVDDDAQDGDFEVKAVISNGANQQKEVIFKIKIDANNHPDAAFSCDPSSCGISGCASPDCCKCYNDALLSLINESTSINPIKQSFWSYKNILGGSYVPLVDPGLSDNFTVNCSLKSLPAGEYKVKLRVVDSNNTSDEVEKTFISLQGAEAGFSCSLDGVNWYACDDEAHIRPDQGSKVWLSDSFGPERSTISDGADPSAVVRTWSKLDVNGIPFETFGGNNSTVTTTLNRLPAKIRLTLDDGNRPPDSVDHDIHVIALPDWIEISPF